MMEAVDESKTGAEKSEAGQAGQDAAISVADTLQQPGQTADPASKKKLQEEAALARGQRTGGGEVASVTEGDLRLEIATLKEQLLRLAADFENYKKRIRRQEEQAMRQWKENLLLRLLPVLDHFELGLNSALLNKLDGQILAGFQQIYHQLVSLLRQEGVEVIEVRPGVLFDHRLHECLSQVPSDEHPPNTIVAETRRGYRLGDKILRAAQVVVSTGHEAAAPVHSQMNFVEGGKTRGTEEPLTERGPPVGGETKASTPGDDQGQADVPQTKGSEERR